MYYPTRKRRKAIKGGHSMNSSGVGYVADQGNDMLMIMLLLMMMSPGMMGDNMMLMILIMMMFSGGGGMF